MQILDQLKAKYDSAVEALEAKIEADCKEKRVAELNKEYQTTCEEIQRKVKEYQEKLEEELLEQEKLCAYFNAREESKSIKESEEQHQKNKAENDLKRQMRMMAEPFLPKKGDVISYTLRGKIRSYVVDYVRIRHTNIEEFIYEVELSCFKTTKKLQRDKRDKYGCNEYIYISLKEGKVTVCGINGENIEVTIKKDEKEHEKKEVSV